MHLRYRPVHILSGKGIACQFTTDISRNKELTVCIIITSVISITANTGSPNDALFSGICLKYSCYTHSLLKQSIKPAQDLNHWHVLFAWCIWSRSGTGSTSCCCRCLCWRKKEFLTKKAHTPPKSRFHRPETKIAKKQQSSTTYKKKNHHSLCWCLWANMDHAFKTVGETDDWPHMLQPGPLLQPCFDRCSMTICHNHCSI